MKFKPLGDRVVIEVSDLVEKQTAGGLYIPDTISTKNNRGKVLAVGNGARNKSGEVVPLEIVVGDMVIFGEYSGSTIEMDGQKFIVMRENEILAVVK